MNQNHNSDTKLVEPVDGCLFPTGPNGQICGRPIATNAEPSAGRRPSYCDNPDHTRGKAFAVRRRYQLAAARSPHTTQHDVAQADQGVSEHPVTDGRTSLAALLARFEDSSTQLTTVLNQVHQMQVELAEAHTAVARAEAEKEAAQQAAEHDRATIQALQQQLEQQRHDLNTLRQQAQEERAALAQHYTDQITEILATIHQTNDPTQTKPATTPKTNTNASTTRKKSKPRFDAAALMVI